MPDCAGYTMGGRPASRAPRPTANFFTTLFWSLNVENTFTNHKFRVDLHVTFGLNDKCILIQYPSWSAKGFGEAIELLRRRRKRKRRRRRRGRQFHWTVELLNPLTHLRSVLRHFSLIRHNCTVARASCTTMARYKLIDWLIDWLKRKTKRKRKRKRKGEEEEEEKKK